MSRFIVKAVYRSTGFAKETGNPFDMPRLISLSDFQSISKKGKRVVDGVQVDAITYQRQGAGLDDCELAISEAFYPKLLGFFINEFAQKRAPIVMDLETSVIPRGRNSETVIVDFSDSFKTKHPQLKDVS
jgi:hypothetical protein